MVGRTLGHYRVLEKLGEGGMGEVYLAEDTTLHRKVALKVLPAEFASSRERLERFQREAESLASLNHPNIVHVYSVEAVDEVHFLTMELVEGESLGDLIPADGLPLERFDLAVPLADALSEAHEQGIVHRDLKPSNVMVDGKGRPKILDFGLAKMRRIMPAELASEAPTEVMTEPGMLLGTYPYMSPEQAEGREADHRSDLFSLGIVLYEMLTGERPFQGDSPMSLISSILKDDPRPVFEFRTDLPAGLDALIERCLAKKQDRRYAKAGELQTALEDLDRVLDSGLAIPSVREARLPGFLTEEETEEAPATAFVGRERELARLDQSLGQALAGRGQVVFVTGEAGTGKTALVEAFVRRALNSHEPLVAAAGGCHAHTGAGDPYVPFRRILSMLAGDVATQWAAGSISTMQARRLWEVVPRTGESISSEAPDLVDIFVPGPVLLENARAAVPDAPWLASLTETVERKAALPPDITLQQAALFTQCTVLLEALAKSRPLLLVVEDLHWSDAGSINLLFQLARGLGAASVLVIGTYRPSEVALGRGESRHPLETVVNELQRERGDLFVNLGQSGDRGFVDELVDSEPNQLTEEFRSALFARTQGHALFTSELLRDMQERGVLTLTSSGEWTESPDLDWEALPARVEGAIGERIARLSEELRELLTVASVEGEDFTAEVLSRVRDLDTRRTVRRLSQELEKRHRLVTASGLKRVNSSRLSLYRFRHVLFQRYLYNDLDEAERAYLHEDVGRVLEELYGDQTDEISAQLARHFEVAGVTDKAVQFYRQAGLRATRMGASDEAIAYFSRALELLAAEAHSEERDRLEIDLQISLCSALVQFRGWAVPELERAVVRAEELAQGLGDDPLLYPTLWFLMSYYGMRAEYAKALEVGPRLIVLGEQAQDELLAAIPHITQALYGMYAGELQDSLIHIEEVIAVLGYEVYLPQAFRIGLDPAVASLNWYSIILFLMGFPDRARKENQRMQSLAERCDHPTTQGFALSFGVWLHSWIEPEDALRYADACEEHAVEHGLQEMNHVGPMSQGPILALRGDVAQGFSIFEQGRRRYEGAGNRLGVGHIRASEALLHSLAGNQEEALATITSALEFTEEQGERLFEPELLRIQAGILARTGGPSAEIEGCLLDAIARSRIMKARMWELRAATDLAGLWRSQGRSDEARDLLAPVYDWFTEGFDIPDLKKAKALLEDLETG